jgi:hypothetical protein
MRLRNWLTAAVLTVFLTAGAAHADPKTVSVLGNGIPSPGAQLEDVRAQSWPTGQRLICDYDDDKPKLAQRDVLAPQPGRSGRVRRCALFTDSGNGTWALGTMPTVGGPARLWLLFVENGGAGRYRLAQVSLWAKRDGWDKVVATLNASLGPATNGSEIFQIWTSDLEETLLFFDDRHLDEFVVAIADTRLRKLMKSPGLPGRQE